MTRILLATLGLALLLSSLVILMQDAELSRPQYTHSGMSPAQYESRLGRVP
jgi:hypothetical protein